MKTKILSLIAIVTTSFALNAQIDRSKMPKPGPDPVVKLGKAKEFTLKNGLKVIMVENHKLPRASANLTIDNKPVLEGDIAGVSGIMGSLLGRGTDKISKDDFNEKVDYLGANVNFFSGGAFASSLKRYFPEVLSLMADGVKNSKFTQEEFDKEIKVTLDGIKSGEKNVTTAARRVENVVTFGKNHPSGEFASKESVSKITLDDVKKFYNTYYKPNNAYLIIEGDINPKEIKKTVTKLFGNWAKGVIPVQTFAKPTNPETTEINFVNMPNAVQSEIAVINNIDLKLGDKDYYAALLANQILGGGGTARLFQNLREDKGYTYGSYSSVRQSRSAATFRATASVRNMVTDSSVVELQKEINKIRYQKVTAEELKNVKEKYIGSFVMNVQKPRTAASYALNIARYNLPKDFYTNYIENINAVTLEDVQNAAIKYFRGDKARIVITGKGIDVLKNLEKGDYKIKYFDKYGNPTKKPAMKKPLPAGVTKTSVINNYFKAIGGADKVKALKTTMVVYAAEMQGMKIESTEKRNATYFLTATAMNGNVMQKALMDKSSLKMNGQALPPAMASEMTHLLGTLPELGLLANADAKLTGIETVDGKEVYVISKLGKVVSTSTYFDVKTGLKVKESQKILFGGRSQNQDTFFSDYKDFGGIKFATNKIGSLGPQKVKFTLKDAKVNEGVSEADFK